MSRISFICYNGEYLKNDKPVLNYNNRAFGYGDGLFETMHAFGTNVQFIINHYERLLNGMRILKLQKPVFFTIEYLREKITRLLNANKIFQGARIRLTVFREAEGYYTPTANSISYLIETTPLVKGNYELNKKGLIIDTYNQIKKPINSLSNYKTLNSLIFVLSGIYKLENKLDDCIILNERNNVCESISSNIFIIKRGKIYTPSLVEGCVAGIMRKNIILAAQKSGLEVFDNGSLKPDDLLLADEIFLTNAISGIRWVVAFKNKRYFNKEAGKLLKKINEMAFD